MAVHGVSCGVGEAGVMNGAERIAAERQRQVEAEGWTPEHDDEHANGELATAANCYMASWVLDPPEDGIRLTEFPPANWPWERSWWKPSDDPIRNLEKAGALIAAEIDRRLRERGES